MTTKELEAKVKEKIVLFDDRQSFPTKKHCDAGVSRIIKACNGSLPYTFEVQIKVAVVLVSY